MIKAVFITTDNEGYYGWYVTVEAEGYEPLTSPVVGVPTAVTDLNLALTPTETYLYLPAITR